MDIRPYRSNKDAVEKFVAGVWKREFVVGSKTEAQAIAQAMCLTAPLADSVIAATQVSDAAGKGAGRWIPPKRMSPAEDTAAYEAAYKAVMDACGDEHKARLAGLGAIRRASMGLALKSYKSADGAEVNRVQGWGAMFSGPDARDLDKEYFDQHTEFMLDYYKNAPLWFNHGMKSVFGDYGFRPIGQRVEAAPVGTFGIWTEHDLDDAHPLYEQTHSYVKNGFVSLSIDTSPRMAPVGYKEEIGYRPFYPGIGWSLTPFPAEPGLGSVVLS